MKPVIGITSSYIYKNRRINSIVSYNYIDAINKSGGIGLILPIVTDKSMLNDYINNIEGLLFSGGHDLLPLLYGENPINKVDSICFDRDVFEMELFEKAYEKGIPILGICRGMQLINVALGGTLYQDINKQIEGSFGHYSRETFVGQVYHKVKVARNTNLYGILEKDDLEVNSFHHQAVKDIGEGLKVTARSYDGIIEGIEFESGFIMGIQWHPEMLIERYPVFRNIFNTFINACHVKKR